MEINKDQFFTPQEIDTMIDALTTWENSLGSLDHFNNIPTDSFFPEDTPRKVAEQFKKLIRIQQKKLAVEKKMRLERAIIMKSKLLKLRDLLEIEI